MLLGCLMYVEWQSLVFCLSLLCIGHLEAEKGLRGANKKELGPGEASSTAVGSSCQSDSQDTKRL